MTPEHDTPSFREQFPDEAAARAALIAWRWPDGIACPDCDCRNIVEMKRTGWWHCRACKKQFSVRSGTVLHGTRKPLRDWLYVIWRTTQWHTPSGRRLFRELGYGSYGTAWLMGHKVRAALIDPGIELLDTPNVVVGFERMSIQRRAIGDPPDLPDALVAIAAEEPPFPAKPEKCYAVVVEDPALNGRDILPDIVEAFVAPESTVYSTDTRNGVELEALGRHRRSLVGMPLFDLFAWLARFGGVSRRYLPNYLAQFLVVARRRDVRDVAAGIMREPHRAGRDLAGTPVRRFERAT